MYRYTLAQARDSIALKSISGVCTSTDEFVSMVNQVEGRLLDRGGFFGTEVLMKICVYSGCVTFPRQVSTVLGIRNPCTGEMQIRNNWWAIMGPINCNGYTWDFGNGLGYGYGSGYHTMRDADLSPLYNDITDCATGKEIRIFATKLQDVGKTVTLFGLDSNGQPLQHLDSGVWKRGLPVIIGNPYGTTAPVLVRKITSVVREATQANVLAYEFDATSSTLRDIALWEPSDTNPQFRRSFINGFDCIPTNCPETNGVRYRQFEALVKLEHINVVSDEDFLALTDPNFTAIKFGIQAIRLEEANQDDAAEIKWLKAIQALNFQIRNKNPGPTTTIRVNPVGRFICSPL